MRISMWSTVCGMMLLADSLFGIKQYTVEIVTILWYAVNTYYDVYQTIEGTDGGSPFGEILVSAAGVIIIHFIFLFGNRKKKFFIWQTNNK